MRLTLGAAVIVKSIGYLSDYRDTPALILVVAITAALCGILLLPGLMTPVVALFVFFASIGAAASMISAAKYNLLPTTFCAIYTSVTAIAVALLGPGSFSLDALRFGQREIVIQSKSNLPRS